MSKNNHLSEKKVEEGIHSCEVLHDLLIQINHKTNLVGPYGELKAILELIRRGFIVSPEGGIRGQYDILLKSKGKKRRIEVRSSRLSNRKYQWSPRGAKTDRDEFDDIDTSDELESNEAAFDFLVRVGFPGDIYNIPFFLVYPKDDPTIRQQDAPEDTIVKSHPWIKFKSNRIKERNEMQEKQWDKLR